ncbi:MAG TPA: DUF3108 domain-containing protein [Candidatus Angelobacter sp.]|nr:DUF3108 domain-containing protein [Candidatus Angelobacter sp.]
MIRLLCLLLPILLLAGFVLSPADQRPVKTPSPAASPAATPVATPAVSVVITAPSIAHPRPEYKFPTGQTFVYAAVWRIFNAGTATLRIEPAGAQDRVLGTADTGSTASLLYKVQDHYESSFDPANFCSSSTSREIEEGLRRVSTKITFDYAKRKSIAEQKNLKKNDSRNQEHSIPACVTDVLSGIFYAASLPLQPGGTYSFPLNDGGETLTVIVHAEAREQLKTPAGTFNTIRVQPEAASGLLKDKGKIWIWYSDDAARIPVQARAHMYWGMLTFTLQRIDKK